MDYGDGLWALLAEREGRVTLGPAWDADAAVTPRLVPRHHPAPAPTPTTTAGGSSKAAA